MAKCEAPVLARAVDSARHLVQSACIVIAPKDYATLPAAGLGMPTEVHQVKWEGFAPTRTKLYELAGRDEAIDWVLMMDADDVLLSGAELPNLIASENVDTYQTPTEHRGVLGRWRWWTNGRLMRARRGFTWLGMGANHVHERMVMDRYTSRRWDRLVCSNVPTPMLRDEEERRIQRIEARAGGRTYDQDADQLRAWFGDKPSDPRVAYYLAQSLKDAGRTAEAFDAFSNAAAVHAHEMQSRRYPLVNDETGERWFWSMLMLGDLARQIGHDPVPYLLKTIELWPDRAEPLHALAGFYRFESKYELAYQYQCRAAECSYPSHARLMVGVHCYSERALREAGIPS